VKVEEKDLRDDIAVVAVLLCRVCAELQYVVLIHKRKKGDKFADQRSLEVDGGLIRWLR
jgi:hypothetical protein